MPRAQWFQDIKARQERRRMAVATVQGSDLHLFYKEWQWVCPALDLQPPDAGNAFTSTRLWKWRMQQFHFELKAFRYAVVISGGRPLQLMSL